MLVSFDHVNIRTANLDAMIDWYGAVLGLKPGPRPEFPFPGAWLYLGVAPLVHLVGVTDAPEPGRDLRLEHAAFRATGLREFLALLESRGDRHEFGRPPGFPILQVNIWDPDGNHLHVDFHGDEAEGLGLD